MFDHKLSMKEEEEGKFTCNSTYHACQRQKENRDVCGSSHRLYLNKIENKSLCTQSRTSAAHELKHTHAHAHPKWSAKKFICFRIYSKWVWVCEWVRNDVTEILIAVYMNREMYKSFYCDVIRETNYGFAVYLFISTKKKYFFVFHFGCLFFVEYFQRNFEVVDERMKPNNNSINSFQSNYESNFIAKFVYFFFVKRIFFI